MEWGVVYIVAALTLLLTGYYFGKSVGEGERKVLQKENAELTEGIAQGKLAVGGVGDVLKKIREREAEGGPLDRGAVRRLFGDGRQPPDPPGRGAGGPGS